MLRRAQHPQLALPALASAKPAWGWHDPVWLTFFAVALLILLALWWYWVTKYRPTDEEGLEGNTPRSRGVRDNMLRHSTTYKQYENHGLLQANYDKEQLSMGSTSMYEYSKMGMEARHEKMLFYNVDRTTGWAALFNLSQTSLVNPILWRTCSVYLLVAVVLATVVKLGREFAHPSAAAWDFGSSLEMLAKAQLYLSALLGFMLGLFVSTIIQRWWSCRMECVDALWGSLSDIQYFLSIRCPREEDQPMKQTVLRLCLLSHRLVYAEARGKEGVETLQGLRDVNLLEDAELALLEGRQAKAQLVLVWVGRMLVELNAKRQWSPDTMLYLDERLREARRAIAKVFAYVGTQLPYQYVHLLSFCVLMCNLLLAVKCGVQIGTTLSDPQANIARAVAQMCQVVLEPFAYHAFLDLCSELSNPFGHDFSDFPGFAFHCYMRSEGFGLQKAGETTPENLLKKAKA